MVVSSAGKRGYGDKDGGSITGRVWAAGFHHVTARSPSEFKPATFRLVAQYLNQLLTAFSCFDNRATDFFVADFFYKTEKIIVCAFRCVDYE
jgi:hypothetical protein